MNFSAIKKVIIFVFFVYIGFLLLGIFDKYVFEPVFNTVIRTYIPSALWWFLTAMVVIGIPIVLILGPALEAYDEGYQ